MMILKMMFYIKMRLQVMVRNLLMRISVLSLNKTLLIFSILLVDEDGADQNGVERCEGAQREDDVTSGTDQETMHP